MRILRLTTLCAIVLTALAANTDKRPNRVYTGEPVRKCDRSLECRRLSFDGDKNVACTGLFSCLKAKFNVSGVAKCFGTAACYRANLDVSVNMPDKFLCKGYKSCENMVKIDSKHTSCDGFSSCAGVRNGIAGDTVLCDGSVACSNKRVNSRARTSVKAETKLSCNGKLACAYSRVESPNARVNCDGDGSCAHSDIKAKDLWCTGKRACNRASSIQLETGYFYGYKAATGSKLIPFVDQDRRGDALEAEASSLTAESGVNDGIMYIDAKGFRALFRSTIETRGATLVLQSKGYKSTQGALIDCGAGSTCNITCGGDACKGTDIALAKSATLNIKPEMCDPCVGEGIKVYRGTNCPVINYASDNPCRGRSAEENARILAKMEEMREEAAREVEEESAEFERVEKEEEEEINAYLDTLEEGLKANLPDLDNEQEMQRIEALNVGDPIVVTLTETEEMDAMQEETSFATMLASSPATSLTSSNAAAATTTELIATNAATATGVVLLFTAGAWLLNHKKLSLAKSSNDYTAV